MNKLKLEVGKAYKTRGGRKAVILERGEDEIYPIIASVKHTGKDWYIVSFTSNGRVAKGDIMLDYDLIGEWVEPLDFDWDCLPAWADKAIAMNSDGRWFYYASKPVKILRGYWDSADDDTTVGDFIPPEYAPKNFTGSWEDSLFVNPKYQEGHNAKTIA